VARSDDIEVPPIQGCQLNDPETFSQGDEARVGGAERQVRVLLDQLGAAIQVGHDEVGRGQDISFYRDAGVTSQ